MYPTPTTKAIAATTANANKRYPNAVLPHSESGVPVTTKVRGSVGGLVAPEALVAVAVKEYTPGAIHASDEVAVDTAATVLLPIHANLK